MKKRKEKWACVPRGKKLVLHAVTLILALALAYIAIGAPSFSNRMAFRRLEKAHMVGPSRILAEFQQKAMLFEDVIIAQTDHSYMLAAISKDNLDYGFFDCYPKTDSMALYYLPGSMPRIDLFGNPEPLTLILFDQEPSAVRAELEMDCPHPSKEGETVPLRASAQRQYNEFFLFDFYVDAARSTLDIVLEELRYTCSSYGRYDQFVTVRLYDAQNQLVQEQTILAGPTLPSGKRQ